MSNENPIRVTVSRPSQAAQAGDDSRAQARSGEALAESVELELISTQALNIMLASRDEIERKAIEEVANLNESGVLARDPQDGSFEIIDDDELQAILDNNRDLPTTCQPAEISLVPANDPDDAEIAELSLVSTLALRKVLQDPAGDASADADFEQCGNFDPYNNG